MVTDQQSSCETIRLVGSKVEKSFNINQTMDNSTFGDQEISQKYHNSSITAYRHQRASNLYRIGYISSFRPGTKFNSSSGRPRTQSLSRGPSAFRIYSSARQQTSSRQDSFFGDDLSLYDNLEFGESAGLWHNKWILPQKYRNH